MSNHSTAKAAGSAKNTLAGGATMSKGAEARKFPRTTCITDAALHEILDGDAIGPKVPAKVKDLSQAGIGLVGRRMYHKDTRLLIILHFKVGQSRPYFGVVRQCRYTDSGIYLTGVEFTPNVESNSIIKWMVEHQLR